MGVELISAVRAVGTIAKLIKKRSDERLIELIKTGNILLSDNDAKYNKYIAAALATNDALERASCKEKFEVLFDFYKNSINSNTINRNPDFYHEALQMLSALSLRELQTLYHLEEYRKIIPPSDEIFYDPAPYVSNAMKIDIEEVQALFHRLLGSGLVIQWPGIGGFIRVFTSPIFSRIKDLIQYRYYEEGYGE